MSTDNRSIGRRRFVTFLVAAPTLTVAARFLDPVAAIAAPKEGRASGGEPAGTTSSNVGATYVLRVTSDNRVEFESPKNDNGQGISTALAMLIAEDMDARIADVDVIYADAVGLPNQSVGGSGSIKGMWGPARQLGAQARARLVTAAAHRWGVAATTLSTKDTAVYAPDGRVASYGSLAADAAAISTPEVSTTPKPVIQHTLVGNPVAQREARDIVTGRAHYALDVAVPGAMCTVVKRPPTIRGTVVSYNAAAALAIPGVLAVTKIPTGVAVIGETFYHAMKGREALTVNWGPGPVDGVDDAKVSERLTQAIPPLPDVPLGSSYVDGTFEFAFVSHAPMETMTATADVRPGSAVVWVSHQSPNAARTAVADATGLAKDVVTVHITRGGGSFGRRGYSDAVVEAAQISQAVGKPVKLLWTRDDDMRHSRMRPASKHRMRITYLLGKPDTFTNLSSAVQMELIEALEQEIDPGLGGYPTFGTAFFAITQITPYNLGNEAKELNEVQLDFPTAVWRSVYSGHNRAAEEIMCDLLAKRLNKDPLQLRIDLAKTAGAKALLEKLRSVGGWGRTMSPGWAQGVGYHEEYNSKVGCLVEIDARDASAPRVTKAVVVADVGQPVNPRGLEAQFMGCVMDGIATIIQAGNHVSGGAIVEKSFADFKWTRQRHAPLQFSVHLMPATGSIGGAGELAMPAAAGAVANAFARATGRSPSRFPING